MNTGPYTMTTAYSTMGTGWYTTTNTLSLYGGMTASSGSDRGSLESVPDRQPPVVAPVLPGRRAIALKGF